MTSYIKNLSRNLISTENHSSQPARQRINPPESQEPENKIVLENDEEEIHDRDEFLDLVPSPKEFWLHFTCNGEFKKILIASLNKNTSQ